MNTRPKVKEVPQCVSDPMLERLEREKYERLQKIREKLRAEALLNIKPYSFEY
jgi:Uncharacterised protein family UPF0564